MFCFIMTVLCTLEWSMQYLQSLIPSQFLLLFSIKLSTIHLLCVDDLCFNTHLKNTTIQTEQQIFCPQQNCGYVILLLNFTPAYSGG